MKAIIVPVSEYQCRRLKPIAVEVFSLSSWAWNRHLWPLVACGREVSILVGAAVAVASPVVAGVPPAAVVVGQGEEAAGSSDPLA